MGRVEDKVVLITGAARGMGRNHALRLSREGADVILVDVCEDIEGVGYPLARRADLDATVAEVEALGRRAVAAPVDIRDAEALTAFVADAVGQLGGLDAAVANAGVLTAGTWETTTSADWRVVLDVNLIGTWNTCRAAIPHLLERGGGSLVLISSAAGIKGNPLTTPYTASKHGVVGLALALANELAENSIRVNTVHPTGVPTGIGAPGLLDLLAGPKAGLAALYQNALPVEMVEQDDVSNAVLWLVSDEARFVTGTQLKVDAGVTIR
jgi:SDR family mycofactocin-dependent oxidoreductase